MYPSYLLSDSYAESDEDDAQNNRPSIDFGDLDDDEEEEEEEFWSEPGT